MKGKEASASFPVKVLYLLLVLGLITGGMPHPVSASQGVATDYENSWAHSTIEKWIREGLAEGLPDGSFHPERPVSRAEFMAFVNRAFDFVDEHEAVLADVDEQEWFAREVRKALAAGYLQGTPDGRIMPRELVSRQEAAVMLHRLLKLESSPLAANSFADELEIADWSRGAIGALFAEGLMNGYSDGRFAPEDNLTRAQTVVLLDRAMEWVARGGQLVQKPGETIGPDIGSRRIQGDVTVTNPDTTLQNLVIEGNLYIAKDVGEGRVYLRHVVVRGSMEVYGGGTESIYIKDSYIPQLLVDKEGGAVRIVASGDTAIEQTEVRASVRLEEADDLIGLGFRTVMVTGESLDIALMQSEIEALHMTEQADSVRVHVALGSEVRRLISEGNYRIYGEGGIGRADIRAEGVTFELCPRSWTIRSGILREDVLGDCLQDADRRSPGRSSGTAPEADPEPEPTVTDVTYTPETMRLIGLGQTVNVVVTAHWSDKSTRDVTAEAAWHSDDPSVASVVDGTVTAVGHGKTIIRAEYGEHVMQIPVEVVAGAFYMEVKADDSTPVVGEAVTVTMAVYRSDGSLDTDFHGSVNVAVSGFTPAPDGTAGSFAGTPLAGSSTVLALSFHGGTATQPLILHHAAQQTLALAITDTALSDMIALEPQAAEAVLFMNTPMANVEENERFTIEVSAGTDAYGNPASGVIPNKLTVAVEHPGTGGSVLVGDKEALVINGIARFTDLSLISISQGVTLRFSDGKNVLVTDPFDVTGLYSRGNGEADNPYIIETYEQLSAISNNLSSHFQLGADIVMPDRVEDYDTPGGWVPIGQLSGEAFSGTFDGGGHTIYNLTIKKKADDGASSLGLFSTVSGGTIRNLNLVNVNISSPEHGQNIGALSGWLGGDSVVTNVTASGQVEGVSNVGGLVGRNSGTIKDSSANVKVIGDSEVGGFVGYNIATVERSFATGDVSGSNNIGGFIGFNGMTSTLKEVFAIGKVSGREKVGGLVGVNQGNISNAYAAGDVTGENFVGGLSGHGDYSSQIKNTYAAGAVSATLAADDPDYRAGGLLGDLAIYASVHASYYFQDPDNGYGEKTSEDDMRKRATYIGWAFLGDGGLSADDAVWTIDEGNTFPTFVWQTKETE